MKKTPNDILADLVKPALDVIICGTAAGPTSALTENPYSHASNKFYTIMYEAGFTPEIITPENHQMLLDYGVGLTDLAKKAYGTDNQLKLGDYDVNRLHSLLINSHPRFLGFNGKKSAKIFLDREWVDYGIQMEKVGTTKIVVLPSTSWKASVVWSQSYWFQLAELINNKNNKKELIQ